MLRRALVYFLLVAPLASIWPAFLIWLISRTINYPTAYINNFVYCYLAGALFFAVVCLLARTSVKTPLCLSQ